MAQEKGKKLCLLYICGHTKKTWKLFFLTYHVLQCIVLDRESHVEHPLLETKEKEKKTIVILEKDLKNQIYYNNVKKKIIIV